MEKQMHQPCVFLKAIFMTKENKIFKVIYSTYTVHTWFIIVKLFVQYTMFRMLTNQGNFT